MRRTTYRLLEIALNPSAALFHNRFCSKRLGGMSAHCAPSAYSAHTVHLRPGESCIAKRDPDARLVGVMPRELIARIDDFRFGAASRAAPRPSAA
jgi:hypothetical protein